MTVDRSEFVDHAVIESVSSSYFLSNKTRGGYLQLVVVMVGALVVEDTVERADVERVVDVVLDPSALFESATLRSRLTIPRCAGFLKRFMSHRHASP